MLIKAASIPSVTISVADSDARQAVYGLRHRVYCTELGQYAECSDGRLPDSAGIEAVYIVAERDDQLVGFIGVTPPDSPMFSVEKHLAGTDVSVKRDRRTFEIRALTVDESVRGSVVASALMYAAFRWIQGHGGQAIVAIGRREAVSMYQRLGLACDGTEMTCGEVDPPAR
jgi:GNAT superfamily N-acetyltransferase